MMELDLSGISLFSGAGGMDVGVAKAGIKVVYANELNKHAAATYQANVGPIHCGDIYHELDNLSTLKGVDVIFGGPPCQGFSVAGKMDLADPRSQLVNVFMEAVERVRPTAFIMENVRGLGMLLKFKPLREDLFKRASKLGYTNDLCVLNAKDFGAPQARERMFFVGIRDRKHYSLATTIQRYKQAEVTTKAAIAHLGPQGSERNPQTCNAEVTIAQRPILRKSPYAGMLFNGLGRPLNPSKPCATLPASMGGNKTPIIDERQYYGDGESWVENYHSHLTRGGKPYSLHDAPKYLRRLTIEEAKVLHTFPSEFIFCGPKTAIYSQIGNAVPCRLAEVVARAVVDIISGEKIADGPMLELPLEAGN